MSDKPYTTAGCQLPERVIAAFESAIKSAATKSEWVRQTIIERLEREGYLGDSTKAKYLTLLPEDTPENADFYADLATYTQSLLRQQITAAEHANRSSQSVVREAAS